MGKEIIRCPECGNVDGVEVSNRPFMQYITDCKKCGAFLAEFDIIPSDIYKELKKAIEEISGDDWKRVDLTFWIKRDDDKIKTSGEILMVDGETYVKKLYFARSCHEDK